MICIEIDELTPCLKEVSSGLMIDTEIKAIFSKNTLKGFTKKEWYENWSKLLQSGNEIYALYLKNDSTVQGLVALKPMPEFKSVYITWMVAAPHNNPEKTDNPKFKGVGGHFFALAIQRSLECGFGGHVYGYAKDYETEQKFISCHGAIHIGAFHPYHMEISGQAARRIWEEYTYDFFKENVSKK